MGELALIAIGGNSLIKDKKHQTVKDQYDAICETVANVVGIIEGVDAVIDKDSASSLLVSQLGADLFIISTSVEKVFIDFGKPDETPLESITASQARAYMDEGHFAPGSMLPKIKAVLDFLQQGGKEPIITNLASLGKAGRIFRIRAVFEQVPFSMGERIYS